MSNSNYLEGTVWHKGEKTGWSSKARLIMALVLGVLILGPLLVGIYWELFLPQY
jgi:hypothetical protein